jgi:hypothetical protein
MAVKPQALNPKGVFLALTDPNTFATVIHIVLISRYGEEIYNEDPIELFLRLEEDFGSKPCEEVENKINAILLATSTDLFYEDPHAFTTICQTLTTGDPGIDMLDPLTLPEVMWGVYEVELNHGSGKMSKHVEKVIQQVVEEESNEVDHEAMLNEDPYDYLMHFLEDQREVLQRQMEAVGLTGTDLPPVQTLADPKTHPALQ